MKKLNETDGFENKKGVKETNVEEDLRNNYETGKLVPYQSVIAEGKIVNPKKKTLKEQVFQGLTKEQFSELMADMAMNSEDYSSSNDGNTIPEDRFISTYYRVCIDFLREHQTEVYDKTVEIASEDT
jgi:hypothetical protein